jgi:hypothetical protein
MPINTSPLLICSEQYWKKLIFAVLKKLKVNKQQHGRI